MRILLVEDDVMIGESLIAALKPNGFAIDWAHDLAFAGEALATNRYDLLLLDINLPDGSGLTILKSLRRNGDRLPVLVLTARDALTERVEGLDAGADDYIVKPFQIEELEARIRAATRRAQGRADPLLRHGDIALDPATHECHRGDLAISLSVKEFAILLALMERPGAVLSRAQLEDKIYGWNREVESNAVEYHIHQLRRKLGRDAVRTLRGVGYTMGGQE